MDVWPPPQAEEGQLALVDAAGGQLADGTIVGYTLRLPFAETGSGGLAYSANGWIAPLDPAAQRQLRADYWNGVRLHFGDDRITVRVNGWRAIDVRVPLKGRQFHVALVATPAATGIRWRNVRLREPD